MLESIVNFLQSVEIPAIMIFLIAFLTSFTENVVPPVPGDAIIIFIGTFVSFGKVDFTTLLIITTLGSSFGFTTTYYLGRKYGLSIVLNKRFRFISEESIDKVKKWFNKYGWWLIIANRFLAGTRAVISFFAGISHLNFLRTITLASISSLIWNFVLIYLGKQFANNWQKANDFINEYSLIVSIIIGVLIVALIIKKYSKRINAKNK